MPYMKSVVVNITRSTNLSAVRRGGATGVVPKTPPTFTVSPQSITIDEDTLATFTCSVSGSEPITLQWYKDDVQVGTDNVTYSFTAVLEDDGVVVKVTATNSEGVVTSDSATLNVNNVTFLWKAPFQWA